jgi:hypothetical protein
VSRPKDAEKPEVKAITNWALEQFRPQQLSADHPSA